MERLALLLPEQHPLASAESIRAQDLAGQRLLLCEEDCAYRELIEGTLLRRRVNPYSGLEIGSLETLKHAVQSNLGLALLPRAAATPPPARTVLRELSGLELSLPIGLVLLADEISPSRALEALLIEKGVATRDEIIGLAETEYVADIFLRRYLSIKGLIKAPESHS